MPLIRVCVALVWVAVVAGLLVSAIDRVLGALIITAGIAGVVLLLGFALLGRYGSQGRVVP